MNIKKAFTLIIASALICSSLVSCSKATPVEEAPSTTVVEVKDADDNVKVIEDKDEKTTIELKDVNGNTLTLVPVYNVDGKTIIAGYIQGFKDKSGSTTSEIAVKHLKSVIAIWQDSLGNFKITYDSKNDFIKLKAYCDKNGFIIALQDALDLDKDKDVEEYFQVTSKLDTNKNLFIKLNADEKGKPINVTIQEDAKKKTAQITDSKGNKVEAEDSTISKKDPTETKPEQEKDDTTKAPTNPTNPTTPTKPNTPTKPTEPEATFTSIVLKKNGKVESDGKNVTVEGSVVDGGTEVHIDGAGKYSKYYVTSETDTFLGQLVFELGVEDDVDIKLHNVTINTAKKTAIKLVNKDAIEEKEADTENSGTGDLGQSGSSEVKPAPHVELSFTGNNNSIKANGSGKNGAIYSECKLAIKGHGKVKVDGGANLSGICSTESITIKNTTMDITSKAKQGISCDKKVTIKSGTTINISSKGDGIHCNKFELDGVDNDGVEKDSVVKIKSLYDTECADGIDADNEIYIDGGTLDIVALTPGKYSLKVRKIEKEKTDEGFDIKHGTLTASGYLTTTPSLKLTQKTVFATTTSKEPTTITVGIHTSTSGARSFVCSPANVDTATSKGVTSNIKWNNALNMGTVLFK